MITIKYSLRYYGSNIPLIAEFTRTFKTTLDMVAWRDSCKAERNDYFYYNLHYMNGYCELYDVHYTLDQSTLARASGDNMYLISS